MTTKKEKGIDFLLHPTEANQDATCPKIEWMGYDLVHCPRIGEWKCKLQKIDVGGDQYGYSPQIDYNPCNSPDHGACELYKRHHAVPKN